LNLKKYDRRYNQCRPVISFSIKTMSLVGFSVFLFGGPHRLSIAI
jgi:hypothetical protein